MESIAVADTTSAPANKLLPGAFGDTLYILIDSKQQLDSSRAFYALYNVARFAMQRLVVPVGYMERTRIAAFFVGSDRITVVHLYGVAVFQRDSDSSWVFRRDYPLDRPVMYALKHANTIHAWSDRFPARRHGSSFYCVSLELDSGTQRVTEFPKPEGAYCMAVGVRNVLTRTATSIALADITSYRVRVYSADTAVCDTLARQPADWVGVAELPVLSEKGVYNLPFIDSLAQSVSLISRLTFADDSTLMVVWSTPTPAGVGYRADVWNRRQERWSLSRKDMVLHSDEADSLPYALHSPAPTPRYTYSNGAWIDIVEYPLDYRIDRYWATYAECKQEARRYYTHYPAQYLLVVRRYRPD